MKSILTLIFAYLLFLSNAISGLPPTTLGSQEGSKLTTFGFQVPNHQATQTAGINSLIETGNSNLLINPSFEHQSIMTGWDSTGPAPSAVDSTIAGKKMLCFTASSQAFTLSQDSTLYAAGSTNSAGYIIANIRSSHDAEVRLCQRANGATVSTNCIALDEGRRNDAFNNPYILPIIMNGTSNGLVIEADSGSGTTCIDDTKLAKGLAPGFGRSDVIGKWQSYTPTFTGFGTPTSVNFQWRQAGSGVEIQGRFISGTATAVEARISLPNGFVSASDWTGTKMAGKASIAAAASAYFGGSVLIEPGVTYVTFGRQTSTVNELTKSTASGWTGSTTEASFFASVPIAGLNASVNTYSQQCQSDLECTNTFTAYISSSGTKSRENVPGWLSGNCTGTTTKTCSFTTGLTSDSLNCSANVQDASGASSSGNTVFFTASSSSSISYTVIREGVGVYQKDVHLTCTKTGADFQAKKAIVGSFKASQMLGGIDYGAGTELIGGYASFGGASDVSQCTSSPCTRRQIIGNIDMTSTRTGTGLYVLSVPAGTFKPSSLIDFKCEASSFAAVGTLCTTGVDQNQLSASDGSLTINFVGRNVSGADFRDIRAVVTLQGPRP
jgi:hypothetical protein